MNILDKSKMRPGEKETCDAFQSFLETKGHEVSWEAVKDDPPDALFTVDEQQISVEVRTVGTGRENPRPLLRKLRGNKDTKKQNVDRTKFEKYLNEQGWTARPYRGQKVKHGSWINPKNMRSGEDEKLLNELISKALWEKNKKWRESRAVKYCSY